MIDHNLIKAGTKHSKHVLDITHATDCKDLYFFQNFLYPPLLNKLIEFVSSEELEWAVVRYLGIWPRGRREVTWLPDSVIEETHTVIENITNTINNKLNIKQEFNGISIWKDWGSYKNERHSDHEVITTILQVYLNSTEKNLATQFECNKEIICPEYVANSGYLMNNESKIKHWMTQQIPKNFNRYSLVATWSEKIAGDAGVRHDRGALDRGSATEPYKYPPTHKGLAK